MNDLENKSESELQMLLESTARILNEKREAKRREAILQIQSIAAAAGVTVVIKGERKKKTEQLPPAEKTFRHPDKPNLIWDGKGGMPKWLKELIAAGREQSEFEVAQNPV